MPRLHQLLSDCCDAPVLGEILGKGEDADGICSRCHEHCGVYDPDEEEEEVA